MTSKKLKEQGTQASVYIPQLNDKIETGGGSGGGMAPEDKEKLDALPTAAELTASLDAKVNKVEGKALSTNDYSNLDKAKLTELPDAQGLDTRLAGKQDKVEGKGLSSEDFTSELKQKLAGLPAVIPTPELPAADKAKLDALPTKTELDEALANKISVTPGMGLSAENFTSLLKQKLEGLTNYDDTELSQKLAALELRLTTLIGNGNATEVIDTFLEIEAFLAGVTNTETLTGLLQEMKDDILALCAGKYVTLDTEQTITRIKTFKDTSLHFRHSVDSARFIGISFLDNREDSAQNYTIGAFRDNASNSDYDSYIFLGWGPEPWIGANCLHIDENILRYKGADILTTANYSTSAPAINLTFKNNEFTPTFGTNNADMLAHANPAIKWKLSNGKNMGHLAQYFKADDYLAVGTYTIRSSSVGFTLGDASGVKTKLTCGQIAVSNDPSDDIAAPKNGIYSKGSIIGADIRALNSSVLYPSLPSINNLIALGYIPSDYVPSNMATTISVYLKGLIKWALATYMSFYLSGRTGSDLVGHVNLTTWSNSRANGSAVFYTYKVDFYCDSQKLYINKTDILTGETSTTNEDFN